MTASQPFGSDVTGPEAFHVSDRPTPPGWWWYALAAVVAVAGAVGAGAILFEGLSGLTDELTTVTAPGTTAMELTETGTYTIFRERILWTESGVHTLPAAVMQFSLTSAATGADVELQTPSMSQTYTINDRSGVSILEFEIDQPGAYVLTGAYPPGQEGPQMVLAVASGFVGGLLTTIFGTIGVCFGSVLLAGGLVAITLVRRSAALRKAAPSPPAPPCSAGGGRR